jgi:tetratricopeptide (TPR) repeat protein
LLTPEQDEDFATVPEETKGLGLGWRILVGLVAVVIIGALAYPFLEQQFSNEQTSTQPISPVSEGEVANLETVVQADPNSAQAQFDLGNAYYEAGDWEQAIAAYKRAVELDPSYQAAYANLGVTYYQQQQFDLAASQYKKALELNPNDGEVAYNLGALYLQQALSQGEQPNPDLLNQAIEQLEKALELSPGLAEPHFSLGVAYMALDQKEEAIQTFETYLSLDPDKDSLASQEARRYLATLRAQ